MDRLYLLTFTVPANTPLATPVSKNWPLEDAHLKDVTILVPAGPSGLAGFRVLWANQQVIPWANNSYLISDEEVISVNCDFEMTATGLVVQGYNTDIFDHTFYFRGAIIDTPSPLTTVVTETSNALTVPADILAADFSGIDNLTSVPIDLTSTPPGVKHVPPIFIPKRIKRLHPRYVPPSKPVEKAPHEIRIKK
jgi:hypothetical protein